MDESTLRGLVGVAIGITLFLMGYFRGRRRGVHSAVDYMVKTGVLDINEQGHIIAGPNLRNK
jgi:hypothetical protein